MSALIRSSALSTSRRLLSTSAARSLAKATHKPSDPPPSKLEHPTVATEPAHDLVTSYVHFALLSTAFPTFFLKQTPPNKRRRAYTPSHTIIPEDHISSDVIPAGITSGAPIDLQSRTVRIY